MPSVPRMPLVALLLSLGAGGSAAAQHGHSAFCDPSAETPEPVLGSSDFDGDGVVDDRDLKLLRDEVDAGRYTAFLDRNADHRLDREDVAIAASELGQASTALDRHLARAFQGTRRYRDREAAIADRFIPVTEIFRGHGSHWARHPATSTLDYRFDAGTPEGLNYDPDGNLWGVFYYAGPSPKRTEDHRYSPGQEFRPLSEPPEGFPGDRDAWHFHAGVCIQGLDYDDPQTDPDRLSFREGLSPRECLPGTAIAEGRNFTQEIRWSPKFHMIHAWLYELNPCGTFAGAHPALAPDAGDPATARPHGKIDTLDPHPDYPFTGGTLCAWLGQLGPSPDFCSNNG